MADAEEENYNKSSIMIKICSIIFLCTAFFYGYAQPKIDTSKLVLNSKLRMVELLDYEDEHYFQTYLSYQPKIIFLKSKGFEGEFVFYKILAKETIAVKVPINDSMKRVKSFYLHIDGAVVFAFDGEKIYNLTGLRHTDFENFFYTVKSVVGNKHDINVNRKNFSSTFHIEDVDLKCLTSQIRKRRSRPCYRFLEEESITSWEQDPRLGRHQYVAPSGQRSVSK